MHIKSAKEVTLKASQLSDNTIHYRHYKCLDILTETPCYSEDSLSFITLTFLSNSLDLIISGSMQIRKLLKNILVEVSNMINQCNSLSICLFRVVESPLYSFSKLYSRNSLCIISVIPTSYHLRFILVSRSSYDDLGTSLVRI